MCVYKMCVYIKCAYVLLIRIGEGGLFEPP